MMDTDAIYSAVCDYGRACRQRDEMDQFEHRSLIRFLLTEAEAEHKSLLVENERLVDEINEARQEISEQARLNAMGAEREARLMARIDELEKALAAAHDHIDMATLEVSHCKDAAIIRAALEKKHEGT